MKSKTMKEFMKRKPFVEKFGAAISKMRKEEPLALIEAIKYEFYFGTCYCGKSGIKYFNYGRTHWFYCEECKVCWCEGSNLFSSWRHENKKIWERNAKRYGKYKNIKPAGWKICLPIENNKKTNRGKRNEKDFIETIRS